MQKVFVDTVAWIALVNSYDSLHSQAKNTLAELRTDGCRFLTSEFVLVEFANTFSSPSFRSSASSFIYGLRNSEETEIVAASSDLFTAGLALFKSRADKEWSLVDCISFVLMNERDITEAFTEDRHFEQAGLARLH
jgi:predicted nucleic acid-binding protein